MGFVVQIKGRALCEGFYTLVALMSFVSNVLNL